MGSRRLAQLAERDRELDRLARQLGLPVVLGEGDRERLLLVLAHAHQLVLEAGDHALVAQHQGHPIRLGALDRLAVPATLEPDDHEVARLGRPILHRHQARLLLAQLLDHRVEPLVGDLLDLGREREVLVVAEVDLRPHRDRHAYAAPLPSSNVVHSGTPGSGARPGRAVAQRLEDRPLVEMLAGVVVDRVGRVGVAAPDAQGALEHRPAGPCRAGSRGPRAAAEMADGLIDRSLEPVGRDLDVEHDRAAVGRELR